MATSEAQSNRTRIGWLIVIWALTIFLAITFVVAGGFKLLGAQAQIDNFNKWGYPQWLRILSGLMEFGGALLLLYPRLASVGAALIVADMCGAVYTNLANDAPPIPAAIFLVMAAFLTWARLGDLPGGLGHRAPGRALFRR